MNVLICIVYELYNIRKLNLDWRMLLLRLMKSEVLYYIIQLGWVKVQNVGYRYNVWLIRCERYIVHSINAIYDSTYLWLNSESLMIERTNKNETHVFRIAYTDVTA
jgi:hypothetical protein